MATSVETGSRFLDRCASLAPAPLLAPLAAVGRGVSVPVPSTLREGGQADEFACRQLDRIQGIAKNLCAIYAPSAVGENGENNTENADANTPNVPKDGSRAMRILSRLTQRIPDLSAVGSRALVRAGDIRSSVTHVVVGGVTFVRSTIDDSTVRLNASISAGRDAVAHAVTDGAAYVRTTVDSGTSKVGSSITAGKEAVTHVVVDGVTYVRSRAAATRIGAILVDGTAFVRTKGEGIRHAVRDRTDAVTHVVAGGVVFVRETLSAGANLVADTTDNAKNLIVTKTNDVKDTVYTTTDNAKNLLVTKTNDVKDTVYTTTDNAKNLLVTKTNNVKEAVYAKKTTVLNEAVIAADAYGTRALRTTTRVASALCDACDTTVSQITGNHDAKVVRVTAHRAGSVALSTAGTVARMSPPTVRDAILATVGWICQDLENDANDGTVGDSTDGATENNNDATNNSEADELAGHDAQLDDDVNNDSQELVVNDDDGDDDEGTLAEVLPSEGTVSSLPSSPTASNTTNGKSFSEALMSPSSDLDASILDASAGELAFEAARED